MECIICQDDKSEPLHDNIFCTCKYKIHTSCWIDYVHSKTTVTCLMCRKERVEAKKEDISSLSSIIQEQRSQDTVNTANQPQIRISKETIIKIIKFGICAVILIVVIILIWT